MDCKNLPVSGEIFRSPDGYFDIIVEIFWNLEKFGRFSSVWRDVSQPGSLFIDRLDIF